MFKSLNIFRAGNHTSANGQKLEFTPEMIQATIDAYSPAVHEAPIVVGHPSTDGPAHGWIESLDVSDSGLMAKPSSIHKDFVEQLDNKEYKKISASFYSPDSANNPVPGCYYLKHVGFLGATPPAVKGLDQYQFSEDQAARFEHDSVDFSGAITDDGIEFSESWTLRNMARVVARVFRSLRDKEIESNGLESADRLFNDYDIEHLTEIANSTPAEDAIATPSFNESPNTPDKDIISMNEQELIAAQAQLETDQAALATRETAIAVQEASFSEQATTARKARISTAIDAGIASGKILPAEKEALASFAESLGSDVSFAEGESAEANPEIKSQLDTFLGQLEARPVNVDYNEHSGSDENESTGGPGLARREAAKKIQAEKGIDFTQAYDLAIELEQEL